MKISAALIVPALLLFGITGCDDDTTSAHYDHTWSVSYSVSNSSSIAVIVEATDLISVNEVEMNEVQVGAGETVVFASYQEFLGPPPDAGRDFWCVSIRRATDRVLVHQLSPVSNDQWSRHDPKIYTANFTLIVQDEDMEPLENHCPRLDGIVRDALTDRPIVGALITLHIGDESARVTSDEDGRYGYWMPNEMAEGELSFLAVGYGALSPQLPGALSDLGANSYRLDVEMIPED